MNALTLEHVTVRYGHILALDDVSLTIPAGLVTGLIGPNGGGKSTLIKTIAGEIDQARGSVLINQRPLDRTRTRIAYVPQAREVNWDFPLSAHDLVMMGLAREIGWFRSPSPHHHERVEQALSRLGLDGMGGRHISQFSGGQQQRLFLARAIVQQPNIVLLDEPMTGLDVTTRDMIHDLVQEFVRQDATVVLASHDLDEIRLLSDRLVCLNRQVIAAGETDETFNADNLRDTYGGRIAVFEAA